MRIEALKIEEYVMLVEHLMPQTDTDKVNKIASILRDFIQGADFPAFALRDDHDLPHIVELLQGLNVEPAIAGLLMGIMYERTVILKQLREQGVVIVRIDH